MERSLQQSVAHPEYLDFFGLTQPPFARLNDSSRLFHTEQYALLNEHLENATASADSLVVICGTPGSGKSTLLDHHISIIGQHAYCVVINETCKDEVQFYATVLKQIGFEAITGNANELKNITKEFLVCRGIAGDHVLVIIDNAHLTDPKILQQLGWLCELRVKDQRVLSVVLAGNADLVRVVEAPAMRQLKFRSHVVFNIRAYTEEETANYVWHRLRLAGGDASVKLPQEAYARIHRYSGGIPRLINTLCDEMLAQAHELGTRVISEKIVRCVADKQRLLPHVIPLHGRGRRRTDPDFERISAVPEAQVVDSSDGSQAGESIQKQQGNRFVNLLRQIAQLSKQVEDLRADKKRALQDIDARNQDIIELREELVLQSKVAEELKRAAADEADETVQKDLALRESTVALQDSEKRSRKLAADLDREKQAHQAAEGDLAAATATVDELTERNEQLRTAVGDLQAQLDDGLKAAVDQAKVIATLEKKIADFERERESESPERERAEAAAREAELSRQKQELQAAVGDLEARLTAANERNAQLEALERNLADLTVELEGRTGELNALGKELDLRNEVLADLEIRFAQSQSACELAQQRILELKSPQELQEIEQAAARLAADLEQESRAREIAEKDLADARATVDRLELTRQELRATVEELKIDLADGLDVADDRAVKIEALEAGARDLAAELEAKSSDLDSLRHELVSRNRDVADLELSLQQAQQAASAAQQRIADLTSPAELEELRKASDALAADLAQERRAREAADREATKAMAALDESKQLNEKLHAKVHELDAKLIEADKRAMDVHALEKKISGLEDEIEKGARELASRNRAVANLEQQLAASQYECQSLRTPEPVVTLGEARAPSAPAAESAADTPGCAGDTVARFEQSIHCRPEHQLVRKHDPDSYNRLVARHEQLVEGGHTDKQVSDALRREQAELIEQLLPKASDDAILAYARLIVAQLDEFQLDGAEPCLTLLVPQSSPDDRASPIYSETTKEGEFDVLDVTLRTYKANTPGPTEGEVWADVEPIIEGLLKAFGADNVAAMQNSYDPNIDRTLVCNVTRALYSGILDLPKAKAANALRWLIST